MRYTYDMRVGFSHSDINHTMTIPAIIDAYQDCSCFHSEDLGVGFFYLEPQDLVWIINYWEVEFLKMPKYPDKLTVGTFPYEFKGFIGHRNFFLLDEEGQYVSKANSVWVLMDWKNMRPAKVPDKVKGAYDLEEKLDMTYSPRKIKLPDASTTEVEITNPEPLTIQNHHLDANGHVNNGQYIKIAFGYLPGQPDAERLRVEYRAQAHLGDIIFPVVYKTADAYTVELKNSEGQVYTILELSLRKRTE